MTDETPQTENEAAGGQSRAEGANLTDVLADRTQLPDGVPCSHRGCLHHVSHPCEGCGRIAGMSSPKAANAELRGRPLADGPA